MIRRLAKILFFVILNLIAWAVRLIWELKDMRNKKASHVSLPMENQVKKRKAA
jgi:hypothetical protein